MSWGMERLDEIVSVALRHADSIGEDDPHRAALIRDTAASARQSMVELEGVCIRCCISLEGMRREETVDEGN